MCAFNQTDTGGQVAFLACMDDREGLAPSASKYCAKVVGLDDDKLNTCYGGAQGQALLVDASKAWNAQFPGRATVPHTFVGDKDVQADYDDLKGALCAAGAKADACNQDIELLQATTCSI